MTKTVYIVGSKGIPAKYGGFETFVEKLTEFQQDKDIQYYVACMRENSAKSYLYELQIGSSYRYALPIPDLLRV